MAVAALWSPAPVDRLVRQHVAFDNRHGPVEVSEHPRSERNEGNYIGPSINRTARLRELAHAARPYCRAPRAIWWSTCFPMVRG